MFLRILLAFVAVMQVGTTFAQDANQLHEPFHNGNMFAIELKCPKGELASWYVKVFSYRDCSNAEITAFVNKNVVYKLTFISKNRNGLTDKYLDVDFTKEKDPEKISDGKRYGNIIKGEIDNGCLGSKKQTDYYYKKQAEFLENGSKKCPNL